MSKDVQTVVGLAITDPEFRGRLQASFEETVKGYQLTEKEVAGIKALLADGDINRAAGELEKTLRVGEQNDKDGILW